MPKRKPVAAPTSGTQVYEPMASAPRVLKNYAPNVYPSPPVNVKPALPSAAAAAAPSQAQELAPAFSQAQELAPAPPAPTAESVAPTAELESLATSTVQTALAAALSAAADESTQPASTQRISAEDEEEIAQIAESVAVEAVASALQRVEGGTALVAVQPSPTATTTASEIKIHIDDDGDASFFTRVGSWVSRTLSSWFGGTELVEVAATSVTVHSGTDGSRGALPEAMLGKAMAAFHAIDKNGDGEISRIEVLQACRQEDGIRTLLGMPERVRQEDGSRDAFEAIFQAIDTDGSKTISMDEFITYFCKAQRLEKATASRARLVAICDGGFEGGAAVPAPLSPSKLGRSYSKQLDDELATLEQENAAMEKKLSVSQRASFLAASVEGVDNTRLIQERMHQVRVERMGRV